MIKCISGREYCFECSPLGSHNIKKTKVIEEKEIKIICSCCNKPFICKKEKIRKICGSCSVVNWRKNTKIKAIGYKGGKCAICNYNKCERNMVFHHLDPKIKEFNISGKTISWDRIKKELDKCVLLCCRCHGEVEEGLTVLPSILPSCNEIYVNYREYLKQSSKTPCPVCGKLKPNKNITCSPVCSAKHNYKINWDELNLEELVKTVPITKLAKSLGISDSAIHKRLRRLGLK